jgi:two-component system sensor histidine kinase KdpD
MAMATRLFRSTSKTQQYLFSVLAVLFTSVCCYFLTPYAGYRVMGFLLLLTVSLLAILFDIVPVLLAATLSALVWDYFFIPPHFTLAIGNTEDLIMLLMYFIIALVNGVLTYKIRQAENIARDKEERENAVKLYNTMFNSLSHELRTPIAAIIGATDNLMDNNSRLDMSSRHTLMMEISKASLRLNRQVDNLLNMSRLESGVIQPKKDWCDIEELVYTVVKQMEENGITQRITININPDIPLFKTDKGMLEQVLYNLLNNAALYTPANENIDVIAACHADVLQLVIEDNGPGFPKEEIGSVFDRFYRLQHAKAGGTGLGLSIVKGFTEALGGRVSLENRSGGGARFLIDIAAETSYLKNLKND